MRVAELAEELKVTTDELLGLLRALEIVARSGSDRVSEADAAVVRTRVERELRVGKRNASEAIASAISDSKPSTRRRRRRSDLDEDESPSAESAEAAELVAEVVAAEATAPEEPAAAEPAEEVTPVEVSLPEPPAPPAAEPAEPAEPAVAAEAPAESETSTVEAPVIPVAPAPVEVAASVEDTPTPKASTPPPAAPSVAGEVGEGEGAAKPVRRIRLQPARAGQPVDPVTSAVPTVRPVPAASAGPGGQVRVQADGYTADGRKKDKKKGKKKGADPDTVMDNVQRVMAEMKGGGGKKKRRKGASGPSREELEIRAEEVRQQAEQEAKTVRVNEFLTVAELSELIDVPSAQLVGAAFKNLGLMVTINQRLDFDQIELLLDEFNFRAVREEEYADSEEVEEVEDPDTLMARPPVVTVMGHVDHGKTLLLDAIRNTNVVAGESGGITQHIGAYHVELPDGRAVSFLDTPGHAAFTAMRARGADVTDIVVLMVAADDSVMPQTIEAISHARNAGVPMVVAINKVDLPTANPAKVKQELLQYQVMVEDFGGDVMAAEVSAKTRLGIDDLLEKILLQAEILELKANPNRPAQGTVIESRLDVGKGAVATVLVQKGTLRVGDSFVCGKFDGRVRALLDERGRSVTSAGPGVPVQLLGSSGVPQAGDTLQAMEADRAAEIANTRQRLEREKQLRIKDRGMKLGDFAAFMGKGEVSVLPLIVKADVDGSVQAVADALEQLSTPEVRVEIVHRAVGAINESDVLLAQTAKAVVIGFRVRPDTNARNLAEQGGVDLRLYEVIYEAVDEVKLAMEGMLSPEEREKIMGTAEVREVFKITRVGAIAGCYVTDGVMDRKGRARVIRDGILVYNGDFASLKRFKDDAREVREGFECGIGITNFNDIKVGDIIECYTVEEVARTLSGSGSGREG
jgi:translation initiation factor IF-2